MAFFLLKDFPRYECLLEASKLFPDLDPSACEAFMHLLRTSDDVSRAMATLASEHGISQGRFVVLLLLMRQQFQKEGNSLTPAELAEKSNVTRATITGLVDTLERDGFVRREPDPKDRRMMSVILTESGEAFMQRYLPVHFRRITELMISLDSSERAILVRLLNKIVQRTAALAPNGEAVQPQPASKRETVSPS